MIFIFFFFTLINKPAVLLFLYPLLTIMKKLKLYISLVLPRAVVQRVDWCVVLCSRDVMSLGITLVGHQKKIMSSIQTMRAQMLHLHGKGVQVWLTVTGHIGQGEHRDRTYLEQCLGRIRDNRQSTWTSVLSASSGCVRSEIIPLFLSEGLGSASSKSTKERKMAKKQQQKKKLPGQTTYFFFCLFFFFF